MSTPLPWLHAYVARPLGHALSFTVLLIPWHGKAGAGHLRRKYEACLAPAGGIKSPGAEGAGLWLRRGQKHQRREKQAQHLGNSEELSHSAVAAVLDDDEEPLVGAGAADPTDGALNAPAAGEAACPGCPSYQGFVLCWTCFSECTGANLWTPGSRAATCIRSLPSVMRMMWQHVLASTAGQAEAQGEAEDGEDDDSSAALTDASLAEAEAGTEYEVTEFQGCGVPSAFADPGAYEDASETADGDRLTDLPKLPLQMRTSGLRVCFLHMSTCMCFLLPSSMPDAIFCAVFVVSACTT